MADKGSNAWLWWSIGGIATLGLGLGIYYFVQTKKEEEGEKKNESTPPPITSGGSGGSPSQTNTNQTPAPTPAPTTQEEVIVPKPTPFTSVEQSNAFRQWVNENYASFAREIDLDPILSSTSSMNNATIQKAWGKLSNEYYTANDNALGIGFRLATNTKNISGGVTWNSSETNPRGQITLYTDGKITANAVNAQGVQSKFRQGGWYKSGSNFKFAIAGENQSVGLFNVQNAFWSILKKAGIYNDSSNSYSSFADANGGEDLVFGVNGGEGGMAQDMML